MPQKAPKSVPGGMNTITVNLWFNEDCKTAVEFYQKALGAELTNPPVTTLDGTGIRHAMLKLGDSHFMTTVAEPPGQWEQGPTQGVSASLWLYVEDCDSWFDRAVEAGCEVLESMTDAFWGDRMGKVKDPFGHCWTFASHEWILTQEEMKQRQKEWLESMK